MNLDLARISEQAKAGFISQFMLPLSVLPGWVLAGETIVLREHASRPMLPISWSVGGERELFHILELSIDGHVVVQHASAADFAPGKRPALVPRRVETDSPIVLTVRNLSASPQHFVSMLLAVDLSHPAQFGDLESFASTGA